MLLYDNAATSVHIHDVIDVIGMLDDWHHIEENERGDTADDFDVLMDAEDVAGNENEGAVAASVKVCALS